MPNDAQPKLFKARRVPFAIVNSVESELSRLEADGIIQKVDPSTPVVWASPTVNVIKKHTGAVRICGDYNQSSHVY